MPIKKDKRGFYYFISAKSPNLGMRWLNKIYAKVFGYFWLPCPICGEYFGGHEVSSMTHSVMKDGHSYMVCPKERCNSEAISKNIAGWYQHKK